MKLFGKVLRTRQPQRLTLVQNGGEGWVASEGLSPVIRPGVAGIMCGGAQTAVVNAPFVQSKNFTVVLVFTPLVSSFSLYEAFRIGVGSTGIRLDLIGGTTSIGSHVWTANGVANLGSDTVVVDAFDTTPVVSISTWTPTSQRQWVGKIGGTLYTRSATVSIITPSDSLVRIAGGSSNMGWYGIAVIPGPMSDSKARSVIQNPWQIFQPMARNLGFSPPAGGNPALTGQVTVAAQGTLTPVMDAVLSGNASVAAQGTLSATALLPLTGQATAVEQGSVAPVITVALTGLGTTVDIGTLSVANQDVTVALTGVAASVGQGALLAESATALSGQSADIAQGALLPQVAAALTGQATALAQGSVLPQTGVVLSGQSVAVGQGTIVAPGDLTVALTGQGPTVGQGALTASITPDPGNGKSGVNRMWLIEYYTKEFAKKAPIAVPEEIVGVAAKRNALNRAKALRAKQIEALAAKAESDLEVLAQGVEDVRAAQQFTYNLIHQAQRQPEPEIDFMRVADSYRKRMKQEDDDLMLFAMVI